MKKYSETVIMAFLTSEKIKDVCEKTGLSRKTIDRYREDPELQAILMERRQQMFQAVTDKLYALLVPAAEKLKEIIEDDETAAQTRVNAISVAFTQARAMMEITDIQQRVNALEKQKAEIDELWRKIQGAHHG